MLRNIVFLYFSYAISMAAPLIILPILGPRLGVAGWGVFTVAQTISIIMIAISDFGFHVSGVRSISRRRENAIFLAETFVYVNLIKFCLALLGAIAIFTAYYFALLPKVDFWVLVLAILAGAFQGFSLTWYYQGIEKMMMPSLCDALGKTIVVVGVYILVRGPADIWRCFAIQALAAASSFSILLILANVRFSWRSVGCKPLMACWRDAAPMGLLHLIGTLLGALQPLALAKFASSYEVGRYGASEKISRAMYSVAQPIRFAFFPRISKNATPNSLSERNLVLSSAIMIGMALIAGLITFDCSGWLLHVVFGRAFSSGANVLKILAALPVLTAIREGFVTQYLIANKQEFLLIKILCATFGIGFVLIWILRGALSATEMAGVLILSESLFVASGLFLLRRYSISVQL
ncbi:oligosaccharide flippase family protein [Trinickia acidisoli]|uniref:oligosaccharide flippase family protein n=1 Tax=Trinickia acidisoli TaxID=2767482 RepID=UPI001A8FB049|nr:oligosaccharide flippase family protein [Trinickia acidisoli]